MLTKAVENMNRRPLISPVLTTQRTEDAADTAIPIVSRLLSMTLHTCYKRMVDALLSAAHYTEILI